MLAVTIKQFITPMFLKIAMKTNLPLKEKRMWQLKEK